MIWNEIGSLGMILGCFWDVINILIIGPLLSLLSLLFRVSNLYGGHPVGFLLIALGMILGCSWAHWRMILRSFWDHFRLILMILGCFGVNLGMISRYHHPFNGGERGKSYYFRGTPTSPWASGGLELRFVPPSQ